VDYPFKRKKANKDIANETNKINGIDGIDRIDEINEINHSNKGGSIRIVSCLLFTSRSSPLA